MTAYFDIHTHTGASAKNKIISVLNFDPSQQMTLCENEFFSSGIHPWSLPLSDYEWYIRIIERLARHQNCVAVGECGLDYKKNTDRELQLKVMKKHAEIAEKFQLPLIIHCVGAFNDLLKLKKECTPSSAWIIHGFAKSADTASSCINAGLYLSVGKKALDKNFSAVIQSIPLDRLFVESDNSETDIISIYNSISVSKDLDRDDVELQIAQNIKKCFGKIQIV
jgi:TatD DNase family protein